MKDSADSNGERTMAFLALPTLPGTIPADVATYLVTVAIWTHWMAFPSRLFKVFNCLFLSLKGVENFDDVHANLT
jgi:hypothetical protein